MMQVRQGFGRPNHDAGTSWIWQTKPGCRCVTDLADQTRVQVRHGFGRTKPGCRCVTDLAAGNEGAAVDLRDFYLELVILDAAAVELANDASRLVSHNIDEGVALSDIDFPNG